MKPASEKARELWVMMSMEAVEKAITEDRRASRKEAFEEAAEIEVRMSSPHEYDDCGGYEDTYAGGATNHIELYRKRLRAMAKEVCGK